MTTWGAGNDCHGYRSVLVPNIHNFQSQHFHMHLLDKWFLPQFLAYDKRGPLGSYSGANSLSNPHNRHPISHPWGHGMRCHLWVQTLIYVLLHFLFGCMQYVVLDHAKMAPNCDTWDKGPGGHFKNHQMETFSALLAICARISPVTSEFPAQRPVTRSFDVFLDLHLW